MAAPSAFGSGPLVIVAFEGWNDAGEAASGVIRALRDQLEAERIAQVESEDYFDYQFNRPNTVIGDDGRRRLEWPEVAIYAPTLPGPHLVLGTEPSRGWKTFSAEIVDQLLAIDASGVIFLGAMLADVPHTRPISVFSSTEDEGLQERFGLEGSSYEGPVGILSVLGDAADRAGIPSLSIWASVPHYVHNAPSPKATLALIQKLEEFVELTVDRGSLVEESAAWESGIDALAKDDDDMAAYIEQLEQARDTADAPEASGEAIAEEFERYLRRRDGRGGQDPRASGPGR